MPTKPTVQNLNADGMKVFNTIRANMSTEFNDRVPEGTRDNIKDVYNAMMSYQAGQNEFLSALVNRIGRVLITSKLYDNPLREFKKGFLEFGETTEEIFVNIAKAHEFNPSIAEEQWMKRVIPDVQAVFHKLNYKNFYKATISNDMLRQAFLSWNGISDLIARIVDSLYTGANFDEYLCMTNLINITMEAGHYYPITVSTITDETSAKAFLTTLRATSNRLEFMSTSYNPMGVATHTPKRDQILIVSPETDAVVDVEALAYAFNMNKADIEQRKVLVDKLPENVIALLVDKDWFMVYDNYQNFTEQYNGEGLYWQYWFHVWKTFSTSPFANIVVFTTDAATVTGVTVNPTTATVAKGASTKFTATVTATGSAPTSVLWSVDGNNNPDTHITPEGLLVVSANETSTSLTVTATSFFNRALSATATVTVS